MSNPSATASKAPTVYLPRVRRTVYGLTNTKTGEWYLGVEYHQRIFTPDPIVALKRNMLWLTSEVAAARLRATATNTKTLNLLQVSRVELELAPDGWEVVK